METMWDISMYQEIIRTPQNAKSEAVWKHIWKSFLYISYSKPFFLIIMSHKLHCATLYKNRGEEGFVQNYMSENVFWIFESSRADDLFPLPWPSKIEDGFFIRIF